MLSDLEAARRFRPANWRASRALPAVMKPSMIESGDAGLITRNKTRLDVSAGSQRGRWSSDEWSIATSAFGRCRSMLIANLWRGLMEAVAKTKPSSTISAASPRARKGRRSWKDHAEEIQWVGPAGAEDDLGGGDARVGGRYRMVFPHAGRRRARRQRPLQDVVPNEKLILVECGARCRRRLAGPITLKPTAPARCDAVQAQFRRSARDRHNYGWSGTMEKLARYLEAQAGGA